MKIHETVNNVLSWVLHIFFSNIEICMFCLPTNDRQLNFIVEVLEMSKMRPTFIWKPKASYHNVNKAMLTTDTLLCAPLIYKISNTIELQLQPWVTTTIYNVYVKTYWQQLNGNPKT